jgi:hypothetical protein
MAMAWGRLNRLPCDRLHYALTRLSPIAGVTTHDGLNHRNKQPPADHDPKGTSVHNIHDIALRLPQQRSTTTQQLPQMHGTSGKSFRAPLPTAPPIESVTTITGLAHWPLSACEVADINDDICLHSVTYVHALTYDNGAHVMCVVSATTAAKTT